MSDTPNSQAASPVPVGSPANSFQRRAVVCLLVLYWLAMILGTHWPKPNLPEFDSPLKIDKILHFTGYFGLTLLLFGSVYLNRRPVSLIRVALGVGLLVAGYGVIDEMTQPYFGRYADWTDWVADVLGSATALACVLFCVGGKRSSAATDASATTDISADDAR